MQNLKVKIKNVELKAGFFVQVFHSTFLILHFL